MDRKKKSIEYQAHSFRWAFHGLLYFFSNEVKAIVHSIAAIVVVTCCLIFKVSTTEWAIISLAIGIVFITETVNTALERVASALDDKHDKVRGIIKDLGAGAVLIAGITSLAIAAFVFIPKIII